MLVPLTQLLRVIKVYFPLALPGPKGINVEITAQSCRRPAVSCLRLMASARQGDQTSEDKAHRASFDKLRTDRAWRRKRDGRDGDKRSEIRCQTSEDRDLKTEILLWERLYSRDLEVLTNFLIA